MVFTIYLVSHPVAGSYVGCTRASLSMRRSYHRSAAKRGSKMKFHAALREHPEGWTWEVLHAVTGKDEAFALEAKETEDRKTSLNYKLGNRYPEGHVQPGVGHMHSPATRAWYRKFHSERPRKRKVDHAEVKALHEKGVSQSEIAARLGCTQSNVSRIVNNK